MCTLTWFWQLSRQRAQRVLDARESLLLDRLEDCFVICRTGGCIVFSYCDNSVREKDWCCRKRGKQAM